jgi:hypothetical protein
MLTPCLDARSAQPLLPAGGGSAAEVTIRAAAVRERRMVLTEKDTMVAMCGC